MRPPAGRERVFAPRRRTRVVHVGDVGIGGDNPIRIQSMTNTDTLDTRATVDQIERLAAAGCEIARVTAPSIREAENLEAIGKALARRGIRIPLVADIHFTPNAALMAADFVEKVRINPGNYADKKKFEVREYSDAEYALELERVAERFRPLVRRCKQNGVAMRIGTNHGSLSDRIMNRHGDSPPGMVESALEFLSVCEDEGYRDVVFSMKASNTHVAIQAYRLLAARLEERAPGAPGYPFHLGVTEAGDALDGRIKSAIGIGSLLEDGLGDTIRVSLTEDPVREVPVAEAIAARFEGACAAHVAAESAGAVLGADLVALGDPFSHARRETDACRIGALGLGGGEPIRVELDVGVLSGDADTLAGDLAASLARVKDVRCEALAVHVADEAAWSRFADFERALREAGLVLPLSPVMPASLFAAGLGVPESAARVVVRVDARDPYPALEAAANASTAVSSPLEWRLEGGVDVLAEGVDRTLQAIGSAPRPPILYSVASPDGPHAVRRLAVRLAAVGAGRLPIVLSDAGYGRRDGEAALVDAAIDLGAPLCDGLGDAVSLTLAAGPGGIAEAGRGLDVAYRILQGARLRTTRTEYISCPSCGRTLFDLEETTARIKALTEHLSGVKIAIMGCIVNGPGEMADADFGYVGSGPGVVTLYVGQAVVARKIASAEAPDRLIALIKEHGRWSEAEASEGA